MNKHTIIIIFLILAGCVALFFLKESGHSRQTKLLMQERDSAIHKMNNERARAEEWRQRAFEYGNAFRKEATKAQKAESRLNYLREQNEILSRRIVRYNNAQLDSIFSKRYSR